MVLPYHLDLSVYTILATLPFMIATGILFIYLIPFALVKLVPRLDALFHLPRFAFGLANIIVGFILVIAGALFAFWSIASQFSRARGTPLPMMATQAS